MAKLDPAQLNYLTFDRELFDIFAGIAGIRHLKHVLEGRSFEIWTDHKPLTFTILQQKDDRSARQQRQLSYIAEFTSNLICRPGRLNIVADNFSRPPQQPSPLVPATREPVNAPSGSGLPLQAEVRVAEGQVAAAVFPPSNWAGLTATQDACTQTQALLKRPGALSLEQVMLCGQQVWCDRSSGRLKPLLPVIWQKPLFEQLHNLAHPGIRASRRLLSARCVWKGWPQTLPCDAGLV